MLAPAVALLCSPAFAALPTMPTPGQAIGGGSVASGDWLGAMGAWFKAGVTILGLVLAALGFIYVVMGRLEVARLLHGPCGNRRPREYFIMAAVLGVFLVIMVTYSLQILT